MASLSALTRGPCVCSSSSRVRTAARPALSSRGAATKYPLMCAVMQPNMQPDQEQLDQQQQQVDQQRSGLQGLALRSGTAESEQVPLIHLLSGWPNNAGAQVTLAVAVVLLALSFSSEPAFAADGMQHHSMQPLMDIAEGEEEFWGNVAKYGRFFVTVMLGTGSVMVQPLVAAFKRPVTAVAAIAGIAGTVIVLKFVLNAMLGVQEPFDYVPGSIVPYS